jgi:glutamate--cysteine ligase
LTSTSPNSDGRYAQALNALSLPEHRSLLAHIRRGIEKEGLRCSNDGLISQSAHPQGLGSALTHSSITTDYSEALLEFITPVFDSSQQALAHLEIAHRYAFSQMSAELIWPSSMPCVVKGELSVPIAEYGTSNIGTLKHVYRHGLWHRYGRIMQCIAGIHYNFSLPEQIWPLLSSLEQSSPGNSAESQQDFVSRRYFDLIRNFRRYSWLLIYLFGASPAVCSSFLAGREHQLEQFSQHTLYSPYATSLRMSNLGYTSNAQAGLKVSTNSLKEYSQTLAPALKVSVPEYEQIGLQDNQGQYKQLHTGLLQIENEYYSDIRPKRIAKAGEKPLQALDKYGVEYIEVRCNDLNPFLPLGLDATQIAFTDVFLTWCLLEDSPQLESRDHDRLAYNLRTTVMDGRKPDLQLLGCDHKPIGLAQWGRQLIESMTPLAEAMDASRSQSFHLDALHQQMLKLADSERTPSAQVLAAMREGNLEFAEFTLEQARQHRKTLSQPLAPAVQAEWQQMAKDSLSAQSRLEASDEVDFDQYLKSYLADMGIAHC